MFFFPQNCLQMIADRIKQKKNKYTAKNKMEHVKI